MMRLLKLHGRNPWVALIALAVFAASPVVWSQQYPAKTVRIVVPFPPGGGTDFIARLISQKLSAALGQQFVVDNRPGAGGTLGTEFGVKSAPDGYTLTMIAASYTVNPLLFKLKFDPVNEISAVVLIDKGPFLVVVHPSMPVKNIKDLIALAKAKPNEINYATSGLGSLLHMATELFLNQAKVKMTHIPYKGTGPALTDTMSGQTTMLFGSIASTLPFVKSGRLRPIAVTTAKRVAVEPKIPTIAESGVPGYDVANWDGIIAPKGVPRPIVDRINGEVVKIFKQKDMEERLQNDGLSAGGGTPEEFQQWIAKDIDQWKKVVAQTGIKLK